VGVDGTGTPDCEFGIFLTCTQPNAHYPARCSVLSRFFNRCEALTQPDFIAALSGAFKTQEAKPKVVEVVTSMWDYKLWWEGHSDSALRGMNDYKCFRFKRVDGGSKKWITVLHVKRFMTSVKAKYFPESATARGGEAAATTASATAAAAAAGGRGDEAAATPPPPAAAAAGGWGGEPASSAAAAAGGEAGGSAASGARGGDAGGGGSRTHCRVLLSLPSLVNLGVSPFKQLQLEGSRKLKVGKFLKGEYDKLQFKLEGRSPPPNDIDATTTQNDIQVDKSRPDITAFLGELAMVDFKVALMKTVNILTKDTRVIAWWEQYLQTQMHGYPPNHFEAWSIFFPPGVGGIVPAQNAAGRYDVSVQSSVTTGTAEFVRLNVVHELMEGRAPDLCYAGHKEGERNRAREVLQRATAARSKRYDRLLAPSPALEKEAYVWVAVEKVVSDSDSCVFDVGQLVNAVDAGYRWDENVELRWLYRSTPGHYDSTLYKAVARGVQKRGARAKKKSAKVGIFGAVPRRSIEVDCLKLEKHGRGSLLKLSKGDKVNIVDADIGFKWDLGTREAEGNIRQRKRIMVYAPSSTTVECEQVMAQPVDSNANVCDDPQREQHPPLFALWLDRLKNWPCDNRPDPTAVSQSMHTAGIEKRMNDQLKFHSRGRRLNEVATQAKERLVGTPTLVLAELFSQVLRLTLWNSGCWTPSDNPPSAAWLPIALSQSADGDEREDDIMNTTLCVEGRDWYDTLQLSSHDILVQDAPYLPWGCHLHDVKGLCGLFQEQGSELNPWYVITLTFKWKPVNVRRGDPSMFALIGGVVDLVTSATGADDRSAAVRAFFVSESTRIFTGNWQVGARSGLCGSTFDNALDSESDVAKSKWGFCRAAFSMYMYACGPSPTLVGLSRSEVESWFKNACETSQFAQLVAASNGGKKNGNKRKR